MYPLIEEIKEGQIKLSTITSDEGYCPTHELLCDFLYELEFNSDKFCYSLTKKNIRIKADPVFLMYRTEFDEGEIIGTIFLTFSSLEEKAPFREKIRVDMYAKSDRNTFLSDLWSILYLKYQEVREKIYSLTLKLEEGKNV